MSAEDGKGTLEEARSPGRPPGQPDRAQRRQVQQLQLRIARVPRRTAHHCTSLLLPASRRLRRTRESECTWAASKRLAKPSSLSHPPAHATMRATRNVLIALLLVAAAAAVGERAACAGRTLQELPAVAPCRRLSPLCPKPLPLLPTAFPCASPAPAVSAATTSTVQATSLDAKPKKEAREAAPAPAPANATKPVLAASRRGGDDHDHDEDEGDKRKGGWGKGKGRDHDEDEDDEDSDWGGGNGGHGGGHGGGADSPDGGTTPVANCE